MSYSPWLWLVVAAVLAADGGPAPAAKQAAPSRVALVGDSLAVGLATPLRRELEPRGAALRVQAATGAHAGMFTAGAGAQALGKLLAEWRPELVLVSLGTNDTVPGATLAAKLPERFALLRQRASSAGARLVFLEPPPLPWSREPIHQAAAHAGAPLLLSPAVEQASDRIHPTPAGYAAWSKHIAKELSP